MQLRTQTGEVIWEQAVGTGFFTIDEVLPPGVVSGNLSSLGFIWTIEAIVAVMGLLGWLGIRRIGENYRQAREAARPEEEPAIVSFG